MKLLHKESLYLSEHHCFYDFENLRVVDPVICDLGTYIQHVHRSLLAFGERIHEIEENIQQLKKDTKAMIDDYPWKSLATSTIFFWGGGLLKTCLTSILNR